MDLDWGAFWVAGGWTSGWLFAASMVAIFFRMLAKGTIRTGREVDDIRRDRDARITEAMAWKSAHDEKDEVLREVLRQNSRMLSLSETSAHALTSLPRVSEGTEDGHEPVQPPPA